MTVKLSELKETSCLKADGTFGHTSKTITGRICVGEHVLRALFTPRGSLSWAPHQGIDLGKLERADLSPADQRRWEAAIAAQARRVDFVRTAAARLTLDAARGWLVEVPLVLIDGRPLRLQVAISEAVAAFQGA